jgi:hypothetical protein
MGMYTEIYINVDLKEDVSEEVIKVLQAICSVNDSNYTLIEEQWDNKYPKKWLHLFRSCSYYTPNTFCRYLHYDKVSEQWSLLGKGDIKNYGEEIQAFFEWIKPSVDDCSGSFIGYYKYELDDHPTLVYLDAATEDEIENEQENYNVSFD